MKGHSLANGGSQKASGFTSALSHVRNIILFAGHVQDILESLDKLYYLSGIYIVSITLGDLYMVSEKPTIIGYLTICH